MPRSGFQRGSHPCRIRSKAADLHGTNWRSGVPQYRTSPRASIGPNSAIGPRAIKPMGNQRSKRDLSDEREAASVIGRLDPIDDIAGFAVDRLESVRRQRLPFPQFPFGRSAEDKGNLLLAQEALGGRPREVAAKEPLDLWLKLGQVGRLGSVADHGPDGRPGRQRIPYVESGKDDRARRGVFRDPVERRHLGGRPEEGQRWLQSRPQASAQEQDRGQNGSSQQSTGEQAKVPSLHRNRPEPPRCENG